MFNDARSKSVVFVAHCILNQNAISDGTAPFPGCIGEVLKVLMASEAGVIQMPCPELHCLGLDRGNVNGSRVPVVEENTRIRKQLCQKASIQKVVQLAEQVVYQILEYRKHGFDIKGIVGINRSPSCGVETTSKNNREVDGRGVFIEALDRELRENAVRVQMAGIKAHEMSEAVRTVNKLLGSNLKNAS